MSKVLALMFCLFLSAGANAEYFITSYGDQKIDSKKPTRVIVAAAGDDLKLLFQEVAKAKAEKYKEINKDEQIVMIAVKEEEMGNEGALKKWGFTIHETSKKTMDGDDLLSELKKFPKILSLDIFSHSSAQFGIHINSRTHRFNQKTSGIESLKANFLKGAYVILHGCNSGFVLAPALSKMWGLPVAGSLTSTNFQRLHSDGHFYLEEEGYAPSKDWSETNALSFDQPQSCKAGYCLRLKPDNTAYFGFWGSYRDGGLPFFKWFCVNNSQEDCQRAMARNLLSQTSIVNLKSDSTIETYKKAVFDFLCPVSSKKDLRRECEENLELAVVTKDYTYNPFTRPQIECDFKKCQAEVVCDKVLFTGIPKPGTCSVQHDGKNSTTIVREYIAYMSAFSLLKN